jgi:hypothetical protein
MLAVAVSGSGLVVGGGVASASKTTTTTQPAKKSLKKFDSCLKKHGVKASFPGAPKGGVPAGGVPSGGGAPAGFKGGAKTQKAVKACSKYLPAGTKFGGAPGGGSGTTASTSLAPFRNCMTLNHVTLALGAYGNTKKSSSATAITSSTYKKAYAACSPLLPKAPSKSS